MINRQDAKARKRLHRCGETLSYVGVLAVYFSDTVATALTAAAELQIALKFVADHFLPFAFLLVR